jgi:N-acetylglucosaminyl-diphospho-decaprenol L-rhamnosyltransferase
MALEMAHTTQMAFPRIAILLINFRTAELTLGCLASLGPEIAQCPGSHVIVVDSASGDGSADVLERECALRCWQDWTTPLRLDENRGFSAGNNAGMAFAEDLGNFDAFLLINSDTIVRPGALRVLGEALVENPAVGLVGPRLEWPDGTIQASCFRNISPTSEFLAAARTGPLSRLLSEREAAISNPANDSLPCEIDWISFACVLIRREVVAAIGPMDDGFFMYFEDVDYCRRARSAGWKIAYVPAARVVHLRGGQTQESFSIHERKRRPDYYYRSRTRYLSRYYGRTGPYRANLAWLLGRSVSLARELIGNKSPHTARREALDIWRGALRDKHEIRMTKEARSTKH